MGLRRAAGNAAGGGCSRKVAVPEAGPPVAATPGPSRLPYPSQLPEYFRAGPGGFGLGSPLLGPERLASCYWEWLRQRAAEFCRAWRAAYRDNAASGSPRSASS